MSELMLFPLSSTVLPDGKMKLRIFEPRYQRMVKWCCEHNVSFGMCLVDNSQRKSQLSSLGTEVKIVDFDALPDGLLGITVLGLRRFMSESIRIEQDGLRIATVNFLENWPQERLSAPQRFVGEQLQEVHHSFPQLGELYNECFYQDANWVARRWLEILPLSVEQFDHLAGTENCHTAMHFLSEVVENAARDEKAKLN
ncbi:LON peptidase substrate-binding domain-containing protein [Vibrio sp. 05-20-BW147]|uniref:LON peptidase substrate-binding domain-containing protein n=1 Tax=Vibrio sp. 05-20-BW147 TaxID=2575834 RepID=UPI001593B0BF|nr:LON peptidase substrate-binding domain-containing protein [Vibrio sp. 05-20-BW147]